MRIPFPKGFGIPGVYMAAGITQYPLNTAMGKRAIRPSCSLENPGLSTTPALSRGFTVF